MRLLRTGPYKPGHEKLELIEEVGRDIPDYAILSHTWGRDEVLYDHVRDGTSHTHQAYGKVVKAMQQAASDGFAYIWIDSCCIDKSSSAELSEAINSMYRWYSNSAVCYVYLAIMPSEPSVPKWQIFPGLVEASRAVNDDSTRIESMSTVTTTAEEVSASKSFSF